MCVCSDDSVRSKKDFTRFVIKKIVKSFDFKCLYIILRLDLQQIKEIDFEFELIVPVNIRSITRTTIDVPREYPFRRCCIIIFYFFYLAHVPVHRDNGCAVVHRGMFNACPKIISHDHAPWHRNSKRVFLDALWQIQKSFCSRSRSF